MGIIAGYAFDDDWTDANFMAEAAHHESAHALRAISFGWSVSAIGINAFIEFDADDNLLEHAVEGGMVLYARMRTLHFEPNATAHVSIAGMLASLRFLSTIDGVWPTIDPDCDSESAGELIDWLRTITHWKIGKRQVTFEQLTADNFHRAQLATSDDISQIFDAVIQQHHDRYYRIPVPKTIIRNYRRYEQTTRTWVAENWPRITGLAEYLQCCPSTPEYQHYLKGASLYSWLRKNAPV